MGHSDLGTTLHYEHMVEDDLLSLVQTRPQTLHATPDGIPSPLLQGDDEENPVLLCPFGVWTTP